LAQAIPVQVRIKMPLIHQGGGVVPFGSE
jgi:hypothetical protein